MDMRLKKQAEFIIEIDKIKSVFRQTLLINGKRYENDAEHSWHISVMAVLLSEYAGRGGDKGIDILKALKMVLLHDIVEIDAGDTYCYDRAAAADKAAREGKAAARIFGLLPEDQKAEFLNLWEEFETGNTPESDFAVALDRLQPLINNYMTEGRSWKLHGVKAHEVRSRISRIRAASEALWEYAVMIVDESVKLGYLAD